MNRAVAIRTLGGDATGAPVGDSVTIPAESDAAVIAVTPNVTSTPDWTNTATAAITGDSDTTYAIAQPWASATVNVVGAPPTITLGDGSGQIVLQGSSDGTQNLVPLHLAYPSGDLYGATITLSDSAPGETDVWTSDSPSPGSTPLLGGSISSVTWQMGSGSPPPTTLYVGATNGSQTVGDIQFTLADSDAGASPPPAVPTSASATTKPATPVKIGIDSLNDPNATDSNGVPTGEPMGDVAGKIRKWLIGQMADTIADVEAPQAWQTNVTFRWTVPGSVLYQYRIGGNGTTADTSGTAVPLAETNDGERLTGTSQQEVDFFWANTGGIAGPYVVKLAVGGLGGAAYNAKTTYSVYTPAATSTAIIGTPQLRLNNTDIMLYGAGDASGNGFYYTVTSLTTPPGPFSAGVYSFLQMAKGSRTYYVSGQYHGHFVSTYALDFSFPYPVVAAPHHIHNYNTTGSDGTPAFADSTASFATDYPDQPLNTPPPGGLPIPTDNFRIMENYQTYVMYLPPGDGSQWVPLQMVAWPFSATAVKTMSGTTGTWSLSNIKPNAAGPLTPTNNFGALEPQWTESMQEAALWK